MILDIDAGNSRIKWRLTGDHEIRSGGVSDSLDAMLAELLARGAEPRRVRLASVRGPAFAEALRAACDRHWSAVIDAAVSQDQCAGVINGYRDTRRLGVDRWLAMLAAYHRGQGQCCVVDAGSAITLDVVAAGGRHLGGYIVPGLRLQCLALTGATQIRLPGEAAEQGLAPGRSTEEAVRGGVLAMVVGWLTADPHVRRASDGRRLYITGGDAAHLAPHLVRLGLSVQLLPDLVLDGLAISLP